MISCQFLVRIVQRFSASATAPTGSGKTSLITELAARLHYPVFEVTAHGRLEFADLVGHLPVREGSME